MKDLVERLNKVGLSAYQLKMIAIIAMLIDHIAWAFVPTGTFLGQFMHMIGRITAPIMCYFIAEGFHHTRNVKRYALRLGIFALISHIPFNYFMKGRLPFSSAHGFPFDFQTSVIYTLFLGLISLMVWESEKIGQRMKRVLIFLICMLASFGDWSFIAVLWILFFHIYRDKFKEQMRIFSLIVIPLIISPFLTLATGNKDWYKQIFQTGLLLAIPLLAQYNGEPGGGKNSKWFFYIFYPLHLLLLGLMRYKL